MHANVGKPMVAYRESIRIKAEARGKFIRQSGGRGQYGDVVITVEPSEVGKGFEFENATVGGVVPKEFVNSIEKGAKEALESGIVAGYPMEDVKVTLIDGSYHEVDSSEMAFNTAASMAVKAAVPKARPVLLEPVMKVEVVCPDEYTGEVISDFNGRRGRMESMEQQGNSRKIFAYVPLGDMSSGMRRDISFAHAGPARRGSYSMEFAQVRKRVHAQQSRTKLWRKNHEKRVPV